ncbi:NADP-dependent oxidoreductase domain-containing protein [Coniochaeta sp. 2T2.1]|nr:NADP-dependent oxidoreductase domain-containing protein [Coniochaeta sp. 2T2.1]
MPDAPRPKERERKIGSRSCDACKIRKVKCSEQPPCQRCVSTGIECTFNKRQSTRGPRSLRAKTLQQIRDAQQSREGRERRDGDGSINDGSTRWQQERPAEPAQQPPLPPHQQQHQSSDPPGVEALVLRLCIYRLRLFPVWPIVAVEEVIAALQRDAHDVSTFALAVAVSAATMAQLKLDRFRDGGVHDDCTAASLEAHCQRIRASLGGGTADLNTLRTSFFLHIYHENQLPGGPKSLLYLREAITLAQIMGLHRASSYRGLKTGEDRLRRRILWLLFVTERGVAALHKLPVVLRSAEKLPPLDSGDPDDEAHILPAFKKLVNLFWIFDQARAFEVLQDAADDTDGPEVAPGGGGVSAMANHEFLTALQKRLQDAPLDLGNGGNDVQKADIFVTRQWMQILVWRATWRTMLSNWSTDGGRSGAVSATGPIQIAQELLDRISQLPNAALEAHGPTIEFKVYEIASAVADCSTSQFGDASVPLFVRPRDILVKLQSILATSRGGNSGLLNLLTARIAQMEPQVYPIMQLDLGMPQGQVVEELNEDDQGWGISSASTEFEEVQEAQDNTLRAPSSPWLSLVAAAELEQLRGNYNNMHLPRSGSSVSSAATSWYNQPLELLEQLYGNGVAAMGQSAMNDVPPSPNGIGEILAAGQEPWTFGLALGLGGWLTFGGQVGNETTIACMKQAYECGINFFDTAESYAGGQSEISMGQAIKTLGWNRSDIVITTKLNWGLHNGENLVNNHGLSRKHIIEGLRASLARLDLEYVDIVYAHRPDRLTPMEETVRAFNHVIEIKGWALYWGTSEWSADEIAEACGVAKQLGLIGPVVEQPFYNLLARKRVEGEFQRLYPRFGLGLTTYSPLKFGLLSGKYNDSPDAPPEGSRFAKGDDKFVVGTRNDYGNESWRADIDKVRRLKVVADKLGIPQSEMALAWCLKNPNVSSVITGASRPEQIVENVKALRSIELLTPEVMGEIDDIVGRVELDPARQD